MPEAAEVTVAAHQLDLVAAGRTVESLTVTHHRTTRAQPIEELARLVGAVVSSVHHHGKWIVVDFAGQDVQLDVQLGIHLRMSGQLLARSPGDVHPDRHVHAVARLGPRKGRVRMPRGRFGTDSDPMVPGPPPDGPGAGDEAVELWFRDVRTFGEFRLLRAGVPVAPDLHDPSVTSAQLARDGARRQVGVKAVLLDQVRTVSGIGSYLADEALHHAGISPVTPAVQLQLSAWDRILLAARAVSRDSAAAGGVTLPDEGWIDLWGRSGRYAPQLRVHGRRECATCGTPTRRAVVGGRSARWCPRCQDARRRR